MSYLKSLPPFTYDLLCYLNRDQLERFSIVCRSLKNLIERYFHSKSYRVFDRLEIRGGSYALVRNGAQWHPNRDDYNVQQFLAGHECSIDESKSVVDDRAYYSFAEMSPYLVAIDRIETIIIYVAEDSIYNPEHIVEMESIAYLWPDHKICIFHAQSFSFMSIGETYKASGEKLELKSGLPLEYQAEHLKEFINYTLERSCI